MGRRYRSPTGSKSERATKMIGACLWVTIAGMIADIHCLPASTGIDSVASEKTREDLPAESSTNQSSPLRQPAEPGQQQPATGNTREGRAVPPRTKIVQFDDRDYTEYLYDEALGKVRKIPISMLNSYAYGKTPLDRRQGRPTAPGHQDATYGAAEEESPRFGRQDPSKSVIPYPRLGRGYRRTLEDLMNSGVRVKRDTEDYMLPQIRYGRSKVLLTKTKTGDDTPAAYVLPYPRPGKRSESWPGSSDQELQEIFGEDKRQNYMIPSARLGRSSVVVDSFDDEGVLEAVDGFLGLKVNPLLLRRRPAKDRNADSDSAYVIPYPRPGKRSTARTMGKSAKPKSITDYVVPYPRPGKRSYKMSSGEENSADRKSKLSVDKYMLPYPRPGRSAWEFLDTVGDDFLDNQESDVSGSSLEGFEDEYSSSDEDYDVDTSTVFSRRSKRSSNVVPYPRLGRSNSVVPYPRLGRSGAVVPYPRPGRSNTVVPYPRQGRSNAIVPYPRPGRSEAVIPYPRPGRSESIVPYPRPGRSDSVVPYPRPGRSDSVVPYPRPGRSESILPYPRPGRSESVVPYPRPGRSESIVPYPRPGRSESVVPYPRPGRSDTVLPSPRFGKSIPIEMLSGKKSNQEGKSSSIFLLPNMRPGRSSSGDGFVVPYPRPGRSSDEGYVLPHPRLGRAEEDNTNENETSYNTVIPYPRLGRSEDLPTPLPQAPAAYHRLNKHMIPNSDNSVYLLPYPRPGRFSE